MNLYLFFSMVAVVLGNLQPKAEDILSAIDRDDMDEVSNLLDISHGRWINTYVNSVTPLLYALERKKKKIVKFLIANVKLIVDQGHADTGETALLAAIRCEIYSCVPLLLRKGASMRARGIDKMNVLHYVALYGGERRSMDETLQLLKMLLCNGADDKDILDGCDDGGRTPLLTALRMENNFKPYVVEELMNAGCKVKAVDNSLNNALHYAGRHGRVEIMRRLLSTEAKDLINDTNYKSLTPLIETLEHEGGMNSRVVEYLIEAGAEYEKIGWRNSAIHIAVKNKRTRAVSYLLNRKFVDPCSKNEEGETAITLAAIHADGDMMKTLLEEGKGSDKCVDEMDDKGNTPLMHSLQIPECQLGVVEILVAAGARLGIRDLRRNSILHHAAKNCGKDVVSFLLQKVIEKEKEPDRAFVNDSTDVNKVDEVGRCEMVNCRNKFGETPLIRAVSKLFGKNEPPKTLEVVKALVEYGAKVNATNSRGESALTYAIENEHTDCASYLLEQKADAAILDENGNTLFHKREYVWTRDMVQALVKAGAPLNAWNNDGETAITDTLKRDLKFMMARSFYTEGSKALYEHILAAGADINKYNRFGEYPLQLAVNCNHEGLVKLFLRYEAHTEIRNAFQETPLLTAVKFKLSFGGDWNVVEALLSARANARAKDARGYSAIDRLSRASLHLLPGSVQKILQAEKVKNEEA